MFMMHRGAEEITRDVVADVETPQPTETHYPIPHIAFLEQAQDSLLDRGYEITEEHHALGKDGARYFGLLQIQNDRVAKDYSIVVGLRNSHDKVFSAGLVLGTRVFVCDNLSFSGEIKLQRSHTKYIWRDLPNLVARATGQLAEARINMDRRIEAYKETQLGEELADHLLVQMVRDRIVVPSKMGEVVKEWDTPSHEEFEEHGKSVWRMHNAATEVLKGNVMALPKRTTALHGLMDSVCDIEWAEAA